MAIIIRLQGLDKKAGSEDIRMFFKCLQIPDGGVYIVGGSLGEAFIAFTTERDGQLAMRYSGKILKGSKVTLHISNMEELEKRLKLFLKTKKPSATPLSVSSPQLSPGANPQSSNAGPATPTNPACTTSPPRDPRTANRLQSPPSRSPPNVSNLQLSNAVDSTTAFFLGVCTVLGLQSSSEKDNESVPTADFHKACSTIVFNEVENPEKTWSSRPGYVRLFGLPASVTKEVICHFFTGLQVQEVIVNVKLGLSHGCLVKFASEQEACEALLFNQQPLGPNLVEVRGACEKMWTSALQECENTLDPGEIEKSKQCPPRETLCYKQNTTALQKKRRSDNQLSQRSPKKPWTNSKQSKSTASLQKMEYIVMVRNLPRTITKTDIKDLLGCPKIPHKDVLHLLDKEGNRTDTAFAIFHHIEDFDYAMNLTGCHVGSHVIEVSSVTRMMMRKMMAEIHSRGLEPDKKRTYQKTLSSETTESTKVDPTAQNCLYIRNMPADVQKGQLKNLFRHHELKYNSIILLLDSNGQSIGEALVEFKSEKLAVLAQWLHGQDFLGSKLLLTRISVKQMKEILARDI